MDAWKLSCAAPLGLAVWAFGCDHVPKPASVPGGATSPISGLPGKCPQLLPVLDPLCLPTDVGFALSECGAINCQGFVNRFAWQLFMSLNWPAISPGKPNPAAVFGEPGDMSPVVWETFADVAGLFSGQAPEPWGTSSGKALAATSAVMHLTDHLQVDKNWLTDQSGNLVFYEIKVNQDEFEYVVANSLYHQEGLFAAFQAGGAGVVLPAGQEGVSAGAIEIKAAWRVVPEGKLDAFKGKYKLSRAVVGTGTTSVPVALVGLHIVKKTPTMHQMVWATFEHRDNMPDLNAPADRNVDYGFFDPTAPPGYVPNYQKPPQKFGAAPTPRDRPVQMLRVNQIEPNAPPVTAIAHDLIQKAEPQSVWLHYELVSAQWPEKPVLVAAGIEGQPLPNGTPAPAVLANTTMESYLQVANTDGGAGLTGGGRNDGSVSAADFNKSSCIGCHRMAAVTPPFAAHPDAPGWYTDYSSIFYKAKVRSQ
jgi:hypothetical protein